MSGASALLHPRYGGTRHRKASLTLAGGTFAFVAIAGGARHELVAMKTSPASVPNRSGLPAAAAGQPLSSFYRADLPASALPMCAAGPAARTSLTFLQLLRSPADATFAGRLLLGVLDPADEFVARQRRDVLPSNKRSRVADQRVAQVSWKFVHHPTGQSGAAHNGSVQGRDREAVRVLIARLTPTDAALARLRRPRACL